MNDDDKDNRTRLQRLLNYKRYVDWLVERELTQRTPTTSPEVNDE